MRLASPKEYLENIEAMQFDCIDEETFCWLIARCKHLTEALTSIASLDKPEHDSKGYWLTKLSHESCAEVLARDTAMAREALEGE